MASAADPGRSSFAAAWRAFALRRRRWVVLAGVIVAAALLYAGSHRGVAPRFVTAAVTRGPVERAVVTTGAVNPVVTVQVGTYVSGPIQSLACDYNTQVKAGQLCAKIDPRPYQVVVDQDAASLGSAEAQLRKDRAALVYAQLNYDRDRNLRQRGIASQDTVDNDKSVLDQATAQVGLDEATIEERRATLNAAKVNLGYTDIVSPVDGIVVSRSVDVGQTVAASFQTPTLFLIAKDLTKMQVDTNVSESDVGATKVGQKATFTVESYPARTFAGTVTQLRQAPITVQNVVTYDLVVSVDNSDLSLLPGMTANTRIITGERGDVLRVPTQALKFAPSGERARGHDADVAGAATTKPHGHGSRVWLLHDGRPVPVAVTAGLSDGTLVEVTSADVHEGDEVIVNEIRADGAEKTASRPAAGLRPMRF